MVSKPIKLPDCLRLGDDFELDVRAYELRSAGIPLKLKPIPMELLLLLVERRGELVTRDQIVERIWGKGVFLDTDNSINGAISRIRQVLRDDPEKPRFVQTVPSRGYRFIAPVEEVGHAPGAEESAPPPGAADHLSGKKISHYRVLRLLGGGGMGVVYEAEDLKLGRRVAMKFLPGEMAADPRAFERFQQEARAASALDHPNICSIYELGEHEGQPFIVMQLLQGQTLREWIESAGDRNRAGRLTQLLDISIQVAEGLEAAHQKGIVHRDIKPANIFITSRGQAKILDFGVAKFLEASEPASGPAGSEVHEARAVASADPRMTRTGASVGTPFYLSPEQVRGEKLDTRTDLFSFGLVLHEIATGQRAFSGNTATVIRDAVVNTPALPVRQLNPDLPAELEKIIGKSLEKDRNRRYQSAAELRADLQRMRSGLARTVAPQRIWPWLVASAAVIAAVLFAINPGGLRERVFRRAQESSPASAVKARPSIAVLGFKNLSGKSEEEWISTALAEMLGSELAAGRQLRIVPGEDVARMRLDLSLPVADNYGQDTLSKVRDHLSSDMVLLGSYLALGKDAGGKVRIDLQLKDAREGETIAVVSQDGTEVDLADLVSRSGAMLRQKLNIGDLSASDAHQVQASIPANLDAARLYAEGLAKLQIFDAQAARDLLQKAIAIDPQHALSHSALAESWSALGYDAKAQAEAKKALDLGANLSREDRLLVEGRYRELIPDFPAAIEIYRTLRNFFPDDLNYGLHLASAQSRGGFGKDALQTIARMRSLPGPASKEARIDLAEAKTAEYLGDYKLMQRAASAAVAKAEAQGSRLVMAQARQQEGWAWQHLGDLDKAMAAYSQAQELSAAGGNPNTSATVLYGIATVLYDQGDYDGARRSYEEAQRIYRHIGSQQEAARCSSAIGNVFYAEGRMEESKHYYEETLRVDQELGAKTALGSDFGNVANALFPMGQLAQATQMEEQSLRAFREVGDKRGEATTLAEMGGMLISRGELVVAKQTLDQAMTVERESGYERDREFILFDLTEILRDQNRLDEARSMGEQALALRKQHNEESLLAVSQLQLSEIALDQGKLAEAESLVRNAIDVFAKEKMAGTGCESELVLTRILLAQGKTRDARAAADRAAEFSKQTTDRTSVFEAITADASVNAELGRIGEAMKALERVRSEANHYGFVAYELEAGLQLGELELRFGNVTAGRTRLEQLEKIARGKGFLLVANKATAALNGQPHHLVPSGGN